MLTDKRCGTCEWWEEVGDDGLAVNPDGRCTCPVPAWEVPPADFPVMYSSEGTDCPCHTPKREDSDE